MGRVSGGEQIFEETLELNSGQVAFPSTVAPSADVNTLDDYEEGEFIPTIADASLNGTNEGQAYNIQVGRYTKIGNRVFISLSIRITDIGSLTTTEQASILGLPFVSNTTTNNQHALAIGTAGSLNITANQSPAATISENFNRISLNLYDDAGGATILTIAELSDGGFVRLSGVYEV